MHGLRGITVYLKTLRRRCENILIRKPTRPRNQFLQKSRPSDTGQGAQGDAQGWSACTKKVQKEKEEKEEEEGHQRKKRTSLRGWGKNITLIVFCCRSLGLPSMLANLLPPKGPTILEDVLPGALLRHMLLSPDTPVAAVPADGTTPPEHDGLKTSAWVCLCSRVFDNSWANHVFGCFSMFLFFSHRWFARGAYFMVFLSLNTISIGFV